MKFPSLDNENPLTWRCKLFGCRSEYLPLIFHDSGERHGISGCSFATATATLLEYSFKGCRWCRNYTKIFEEETEIWPKWLCTCETCRHNSAYWKREREQNNE